MGFISNNTNASSQGNVFGGFQSSNEERQKIDQLLEAAKLEGGAVAEVAHELSNPRSSMLSTIGNGFKNAFSGFVDIISAPSNIVAGAISPDKTIKEALDDNTTVSEVIFGERDKSRELSGMQKIGGFVVRTAVDILTDPLTYVTFGATKGILGISKLKSLEVTGKFADDAFKILDKSDKELASILGNKASVGKVKDVARQITKQGEGGTIHLSQKGEELLNTFLRNKRNGLSNTITQKDVKRTILEQAKSVGKKLTPDELTKRTINVMNGVDDAIIQNTINKRLSVTEAEHALRNMLVKHPALLETLVDRGGVKFLSKTVLSGQRIAAVKPFIPGLTLLDNVTEPYRNKVKALFSTAHSIHGKKPQGILSLQQRARDMAMSMQNEAMEDLLEVGKRLKLTENEVDLVMASLQYGKSPNNKKLVEIVNAAKGLDFDPNVVRPEVFQGTRFFQNLRKKNLKMMRDNGLPISDLTNYTGNIFVKQDIKNIPFKPGLRTKIPAEKMAKASTFVADDGTRIPGFIDKIEDGKLTLLEKGADGKLTEGRTLLKQQGNVFLDEATGQQLKRAQISVDEAGELGLNFEKNAVKVFAVKTQEAIKASVSNRFLKDISSQYGRVASEAPEGYVRVKSISDASGGVLDLAQYLKGKNGEDVLFDPMIAKEIEEFSGAVFNDEATDVFLKAFDKIQNAWKASVTSVFPAFHGRNAISNVFLHYLDIGLHSLNPKNHLRSARIMSDAHKASKLRHKIAAGTGDVTKHADELFDLLNKEVFTDVSGQRWTMGELQSVIQRNVVGLNPNLVGQVDVSKNSQEMVEDLTEELFPTLKSKLKKAFPFSQRFVPFKVGRKVGNFVEDQARILDFIVNLEKTGDPIQAAQRTKMFLFDYQNLTKFEKTIMRRLVPFYTFAKKNLELQAKTLFSNPGRIAAEVRSISTIGDVLSNSRLTEEEKKQLPEWMRDSLTILKSRNGNLVEIFGSLGTPIEAAFQQTKPNQVIGSLTPLAKIPLELASGYSFFHGKPISEVTNAAAFASDKVPAVLKDLIGFTEVEGTRSDGSSYKYYVSLRPRMMHMILNLPPTSRVFSTMKQMQTVDVSEQSKLLRFLIGTKASTFDLNVEEERREKELRKSIENILDDANVGYKIERFVLPKK